MLSSRKKVTSFLRTLQKNQDAGKYKRNYVIHENQIIPHIMKYIIKGRKKITEKDRELDLKTFEIPYEERDHALYVAFGPYKSPRYALSVIVEHGGNGSTTAAPMAKELFKLIIDRHEIRQLMDNKRYLEV